MTLDRFRDVSTSIVVAVISVLVLRGTTYADVNRTPMAVPVLGSQGPASVYPSTLTVRAVRAATDTDYFGVALYGVTHPCPQELALLLVHNDVEKYLLMANAGGCQPLQGTSLWISSSGAPPLPQAPTSTTPHGAVLMMQPSFYAPLPVLPAPAPPGPYAPLPERVNVNGTWRLYVHDTGSPGRGVIAGGWSIGYPPFISNRTAADTAVPGDPSSGRAARYPLTFDFSSVSPTVRVDDRMGCALQLAHQRPIDLQIVLQSPSGTAVVLMANAGGSRPFDGSVAFTSSPSAPIDRDAPLQSGGAYRPGNQYGANVGVPDGPPLPYETSFAAFEGEPVTGIWRLWVYDDDPDGYDGILRGALLQFDRFSPHALGLPLTAASQQPFARVQAVPATPHITPTTPLAMWRVTQPGNTQPEFYAAGALDVQPGSPDLLADVPLKRGENLISLIQPNFAGAPEELCCLRRTVTEFIYALAEGATGAFFDLDVTVSNLAGATAPVTLEFLPESGASVAVSRPAGTDGPLQVRVDDVVPAAATSTVVRSPDAVPLVVERTMSWNAGGYGGHGGGAVNPATRWLFAEGSQGFFHTYVLLANDGASAVDVDVRFLIEGGGTARRAVRVPARTRRTLYAGDVQEAVGHSFGLDITASAPIIAERAMYFSMRTDRVFDGGHESAGVNETSTRWFLAEGATGPFFDCFVLVSNPNATPAQVTLTYLLPTGETIPQAVTLPANSRRTINVETVDARLANAAVSTIVTSDIGVVVERAMYWSNITEGWREAHNSFGVTRTGLRWGVADGRTGGPRGHETYILLANPNPQPAEVQVRFLKAGVNATRTYVLPPMSRWSIQAGTDVPELADGVFSAEIQVLNYQPVAVEKAMYWNAEGVTWAAGTNVTATLLPPR